MLSLFSRKVVVPAVVVSRNFSTNLVDKVVSLETANQSLLTKLAVRNAITKYQRHKTDTGSAPAQSKIIPLCHSSRVTLILSSFILYSRRNDRKD